MAQVILRGVAVAKEADSCQIFPGPHVSASANEIKGNVSIIEACCVVTALSQTARSLLFCSGALDSGSLRSKTATHHFQPLP